jgi:hypothetical protein
MMGRMGARGKGKRRGVGRSGVAAYIIARLSLRAWRQERREE